MRVDSLSEYL